MPVIGVTLVALTISWNTLDIDIHGPCLLRVTSCRCMLAEADMVTVITGNKGHKTESVCESYNGARKSGKKKKTGQPCLGNVAVSKEHRSKNRAWLIVGMESNHPTIELNLSEDSAL